MTHQEYKAEWYQRNKERLSEKAKRYRRANLEKVRARDRERKANDPRRKESQRAYYRRVETQPEVRERRRAANRARDAKYRRAVVDGYGGRCACCGNDYLSHLALDHVNGNGSADRKKRGGGRVIYATLYRLLPERDSGFQVLCHNCNTAKHWHGRCGCQDNG